MCCSVQLLVRVFKDVVAKDHTEEEDGRSSHLDNFYVCVPALTLSYISALRSAKDSMGLSVKV